jgi:hypothetical protein
MSIIYQSLKKAGTKKIPAETRITNQLTIKLNPFKRDMKYANVNDLLFIIIANLIKLN